MMVRSDRILCAVDGIADSLCFFVAWYRGSSTPLSKRSDGGAPIRISDEFNRYSAPERGF